MKKHINIPVFIPHLGCPNQCVFCNQRSITGVEKFEPSSVKGIIDDALSTVQSDTECEIAFFGGSFTGIDFQMMCELLNIANSYIKEGRVESIRCSTRPDYINPLIIDTLKAYGVKTVELGLQSYDDAVLRLSKRGHDSSCEERACKMIVDSGLELVGQMMIGLPGSTPKSEEATARFIVECGATAARIYPTVVFKETELCRLTEEDSYKPLSVDEAVSRSTRVLAIFREAGVKVIRIGLCASENLADERSYMAGPNHPALGELVENEFYYEKIKSKIDDLSPEDGSELTVFCAAGALSKVIGQNKKNKLRLSVDYPNVRFKFDVDGSLSEYDVAVRYTERTVRCF